MIMYMETIDHLLNNKHYDKIMHLKICVSDNLYSKYESHVDKHNTKMRTSSHPDSGFDIFTPTDYNCATDIITKINFEVKCSAKMVKSMDRRAFPTGFYMYPRSSISNTPLTLANSVGIIDSGYRGNLIGAFRCHSHGDEFKVLKGDRLVQICAPDLSPIVVELVKEESMLGTPTERGSGGFGSTGV